MLPEQIQIDRDGAANRQLIETIKSRLSACNAKLPFMLLPIRIETRFMRVDRPVRAEVGIDNTLLDRLKAVQNSLSVISNTDFATELGSDSRKAIKQREQAHYQLLDQQIESLASAHTELSYSLRNSGGSTLEDAEKLLGMAKALQAEIARAKSSVTNLRSDFQKAAYIARIEQLERVVFSPISDELAEAARKLELVAKLRFIDVAEVRAQVAKIRGIVERFNRAKLRSYDDLEAARDDLYPALNKLRHQVHAIIRGDGEAITALHDEWQQVDLALATFQEVVAKVPVSDSYQAAGRTRTQTHIEHEYRADLIALTGGSVRRFQVLSNSAFIASADAAYAVSQLLEEQASTLQVSPLPSSRLATQLLALARNLLTAANRVNAQSRNIAIIPSDRYAQMTALHEQIEATWTPWQAKLKQLATTGGRDAAEAATLLKQIQAVLDSQEKAIFGQRMDVWDAYDRFYDEFRRKIFAIDTTEFETVDELWVRFYPDDIAIHSHEGPLSEDEERDGRDFWIETYAAESDEELKRGAWRALARLHGSRRAAWIRKQMTPELDNSFAQGGANLLRAVETLQKRVAEVSTKSALLTRDPLKNLARIQSAIDAAITALNLTRRLTARQHLQLNRLLRVIGYDLNQIIGRFDKRLRFLSGVKQIESALQILMRSFEELAQGIAALPQFELREEVIKSLAFPSVERRDAAWSVAPHCKVLPDHFVTIAIRGGQVVHAVAGEQISEIKVGLDPDPESGDAAQFMLDEEGRLQVGDSIRWMTDFDTAVECGMGVTIRLSSEEAKSGFDELLVLGIRDLSANETATLVEQLLDNHHFNEEGMSFLPLGTPTNNSEEQASAWHSSDDPDASYEIECSAPLFDPSESDQDAKVDAHLFADALGIDPSVVAHLEHADSLDMSSGAIFNRALWPATLGLYLEEFLGGLVSTAAQQQLQAYFGNHVSARGKLPAFRVGSQPYGVLVTTAFSRFVPTADEQIGGNLPNFSAEQRLHFERMLHRLLSLMAEDWSGIRRAKVPHVLSENVDDAQQHFMRILGLQATSSETDYRYALNVGGRHKGPGDDFDYVAVGPEALLTRFEAFFRAAYQLSGPIYVDKETESGASRAVSEPFKALLSGLFDSRCYDLRYVKNVHALRGSFIGGDHAAEIGQLLSRSVATLLQNGLTGSNQSLLLLLLRQALMVQMRFTALNILEIENMLDAKARVLAGSADEFRVQSLFGDEGMTKWRYLLGDLSQLNSRYDIDFPIGSDALFSYLTTNGSHTMADYLAQRCATTLYSGFSGHARHAQEVAALQSHAADVERLKALSAPALERLLHEHIDLCSYRLDAWQLGLANRRLQKNRSEPATADGLYLGAYGWVENLRPGGERALAEQLPAALHIDGEAPVYSDEDNQGFIHTPSLNHAVTAAVLRSGYLTEADQTDIDNRMAVNLSSRRVRNALNLLDGVQSGQDLGVLLGYRFERELHEAYRHYGTSYDDLIYDFRRAFPGSGSVDPDSAAGDGTLRVVVDGLALLDTANDWIEQHVDLDQRRDRTLFDILRSGGSYSGRPWGLPTIDDARLDGVLQAIDHLVDAVDALSDLALAEGVFQIVRGNFPRAAAVLSALAEGRAMPTPQVVDTPRSSITLTQRVLLPLSRVDGRTLSRVYVEDDALLSSNRQLALPAAWSGLPMTPRSNAEPGLNRWLAELMGAPEQILCLCATQTGTQTVSAVQLGLQPIDWLALLGGGLEEAEAELATRLMALLLPADTELGAAVAADFSAPQIQFANRDPLWGAEIKTVYEIAALLGEVNLLLGKARPANSDDLALQEGSVEAGAAENSAWDYEEVDARLSESQARLSDLTMLLMQRLNGDALPTESPLDIEPAAWAEAHRALLPSGENLLARFSEYSNLLLQAAEFGVKFALPPLDFSSVELVATTLSAALVNAFVQLANRLQAFSLTAEGGINARFDAAKQLFGKDFVLIPAFSPESAAPLQSQLGSDSLLRHGGPFVMDGFLAGAATVRENLNHLQRVWALGEAFGAAPAVAKPAQFPESSDDYWLGVEFPSDHEPESDKLSLVVINPALWELGSASVQALLLDHWTETIPLREETSGVTFFYDQPDATPPQSVILAVAPSAEGSWQWEDLIHTLHDTLEIARNRTVEPEHLDDTLYAQLLPALLGEVIPRGASGGGDDPATSRAILDFSRNR